MANYYCTARTNYFRVKDEPAFRAWVEKRGFTLAGDNNDGFTLLGGDGNDSGDLGVYDDEADDSVHASDEIAQFLTDDSVAVFMEAGAEKLRYICGTAIAVNSKNEQVVVSLDQIYEKATAAFGITPTRAEN